MSPMYLWPPQNSQTTRGAALAIVRSTDLITYDLAKHLKSIFSHLWMAQQILDEWEPSKTFYNNIVFPTDSMLCLSLLSVDHMVFVSQFWRWQQTGTTGWLPHCPGACWEFEAEARHMQRGARFKHRASAVKEAKWTSAKILPHTDWSRARVTLS